jgi:hypothetical protein
MIDYFLNWMGPINQSWIKENGSNWSSGRIDIDGIEGEPFGMEYSIPPMDNDDWSFFGNWLDTLETKDVWTLERILNEYELHNKPIKWLKNEK